MNERAEAGQGFAGTQALRDLALAVAGVAIAGSMFAAFDAVERITSVTARFERAELDDVLLALSLAFVLAAWFAARRWAESRASLRALQESERVQRHYTLRLEELSSALLAAEDQERHRIAELVHDDLGQALYACRLRLSVLSARLSEGELRQLCDEVDAMTSDALTRARDLSTQLSPPALTDLGVPEALEALVPQLARRYAIEIALEPSDALRSLPKQAHAAVFHSVQELVVNAVKHARAQRVTIWASSSPESVDVQVADDGRGFDTSARARHAGFGLFSIERRMACVGGALRIASSAVQGTTATLHVPL